MSNVGQHESGSPTFERKKLFVLFFLFSLFFFFFTFMWLLVNAPNFWRPQMRSHWRILVIQGEGGVGGGGFQERRRPQSARTHRLCEWTRPTQKLDPNYLISSEVDTSASVRWRTCWWDVHRSFSSFSSAGICVQWVFRRRKKNAFTVLMTWIWTRVSCQS